MSTLHINQPIRIDSAVTIGVAKVRVTRADLTDADGSQTLVWNTLAVGQGESPVPANARIMYAWGVLREVFAGGTASAVTVSLGDVGSTTELFNALNVFTGQTLGMKGMNGSYTRGTLESDYGPRITVASADDDLDNLETGIIDLYIQYEAINTDAVLA